MHVGGVLRPRGAAGRPGRAGGAGPGAAAARAALPAAGRPVPGHLANPVWVDDPDFDLAYHIRRSALPAPGTEAQLLDLVSRLTSRPLDRRRPLWEMYLVEGLSGAGSPWSPRPIPRWSTG